MSKLEREPVVRWSALTGLILAVLTFMQEMGYIDLTGQQTSSIEALLVALGVFIVPIIVAFFPRARVTPLSDPRDMSGNPLYPRE